MKKPFLSSGQVLPAAGCASAPVREGAVTVAPGERVVDLRAGSCFFSPAKLMIPAGQPAVIRVANEATLIPHSFLLESPNGNVLLRQTLVRLAPLAEGTYTFCCGESLLGSTHRGKGTKGTLAAVPEAK